MASELAQAIQEVCDDKKIPLESVIQTIESALAAAYRKDFGNKMQNIKIEFEMETGAFKVFDIKEVVEDELKEEYERIKEEKMKLAEEEIEGGKEEVKKEEVKEEGEGEEDAKRFNPKTMISLSEAKEIKKKVKVGEELVQKLEVGGEFGRMAAQTAKQVVIQKLREAERNTILEEYRSKIGDLLTGTVQRVEGRVVLVDFGNTTAVMPLEEGIRSEKYVPGARFKFYVKNVEESSRGPKVIVSRTHPDILRKLFKLEVPEIASGTVQIKSIAREAGSRSKIAVAAKEESLDPIGSCVGQRGTRVQTIINEIGGEKIDIIEWEDDPVKFIAKALAPAKVIKVEIKGEDKKKDKEKGGAREAVVHVVADQLSLAIGKEGQNVRLAAKLTGWKIDIVGEKLEEDKKEETKEAKEEKKEAKEEKKEEEKEEKKDEKKEKKGEVEEKEKR